MVIGDRQGITVAPVTKEELTLVVGAPQGVRFGDMVERRALRLVAPSFAPLDETVAIEDCMNSAVRGRLDDGILAQ